MAGIHFDGTIIFSSEKSRSTWKLFILYKDI
jgi:hypothetical protein